MNLFSLSLFCCGVFLLVPEGSAKTENEEMQEYLEHTLNNSNYDKRIAPVGINGPGSPVKVNVSMYFLDISKVNYHTQEFDAQFYFRQYWQDSRLKVSDPNFDSVTLREVDKIWTPDLFFVNEKVGSLNNMIQPNVFCRISTDGNVRFSIRATERLSCSMDLRNYPLDTHKCTFRVESYGYTLNQLELNWLPDQPVKASPNITEDDFELIEVEQEVRYETVDSGTYGTLEVHLTFERKFGHVAKRMYGTFTILVLLSWLSLWIKAKDKYLRLAFLLVILYLMVTIAAGLEWYIPHTPYTKASDVWIVFCEAMVFAAFLEFITVCITSNGAEENSSRTKGEILSTLDPEAKETDLSTNSVKSPLSKFMSMFEARNGGLGRNELPHRVDRFSRFLFPITFLLFNIVYWSVYRSA